MILIKKWKWGESLSARAWDGTKAQNAFATGHGMGYCAG